MSSGQTPKPWRFFVPRLAGGNLNDRLIACVGAALGVLAAATAGLGVQNVLPTLPFLIAPLGATAVLVFAVPASPLAQPWPVFGGNIVSACIGVTVLHLVPVTFAAIGIAVASSILVMSLLRCLHPPSGAVTITTILGGQAIVVLAMSFPSLWSRQIRQPCLR